MWHPVTLAILYTLEESQSLAHTQGEGNTQGLRGRSHWGPLHKLPATMTKTHKF